ncbi:toxin, partial [Bacillus thuringiensis]
RNNPINFIDPDGNAPQDSKNIVNNFKNGDLIYGLFEPRGSYLLDVRASSQYDNKIAGTATVNDYNNTIAYTIMRVNNRYNGRNTKGFANSLMVPNPKALNKLISSHDLGKLPLWKGYFKAGEKNVKFHIPSIYEEVAENFGKDFYHQYFIDDLGMYNHTPLLLWKRGSKLTLAMAASNKKTQRHFVLDGLDMEHVVNKTKGTGNSRGPGDSVTASELRYVYRNYDKLKGRVIFYRNNEKLDKAPWEENPGLWGAYKPTNRPIQKPGSKNCLGCLLMRRK